MIKIGDKVRYNGQIWEVDVLDYPKMTLTRVNENGLTTKTNPYAGYRVEEIEEDKL